MKPPPAQLTVLLHGNERGHNRFRDSDYHGLLVAYDLGEIRAEVERLIR